ncbi:MAG: hypothetical protein HY893_00540 [Deltaproteobacteria bacterium]|nr:hypothetical protein [Deltaproteobacteria bacterium]
MNVGAVSTPGTSSTASTSAGVNDAMGKDSFLKLLVTQLQNQDPLNPTDNTQFVAQLAQFSSLEGITNLNTSMDSVSKGMASLESYNSAGLVGRVVKAGGNQFGFAGSPVVFGYDLANTAASTSINVYDGAGRAVKNITMGPAQGGYYEVNWDGTDDSGNVVSPGAYTFTVNAKDANNSVVGALPYVTGLVSSVTLDAGKASLNVGGTVVSMDNVKEIY